MDEFLRLLLARPEMLRMGHAQSAGDANLGLGWLYYALGRIVRPSTAVVIGSHRGFVPVIFGKALADNGDGGTVVFIDPSLADAFWTDPMRVQTHFSELGAPNVRHHLMTTQEFRASDAYRVMGTVGLAMIDGYHTAEQARFDYLTLLPHLAPEAVVLFHDSLRRRESRFYGAERAYEHSVCDFVDELRRARGLQVMDWPYGAGLTVVRGRPLAPDSLRAPAEPATGQAVVA